MKKLYLGIGVNKYQGSPLRGCVNDIEDLFTLLVRQYGFKAGDDMRVLCDERATREAIMTRMDWLVDRADQDDIVVFQYSGHGSQMAARDDVGEIDGLDEILLPYDYYLNWDTYTIRDNELFIFAQKLFDKGAIPVFVIDACHSGTATRDIKVSSTSSAVVGRFMGAPFDIRSRAFGPVDLRAGLRVDEELAILVSGCQDTQTSADAYIDGRFNGAMTRGLIDILEQNPVLNWEDLKRKLPASLDEKGFEQRPVISGRQDLLSRKIFA